MAKMHYAIPHGCLTCPACGAQGQAHNQTTAPALVTCQRCGGYLQRVGRRAAQWIGEAATEAEDAYRAGDYDTMKACLETIQMHALDLGYDPDRGNRRNDEFMS